MHRMRALRRADANRHQKNSAPGLRGPECLSRLKQDGQDEQDGQDKSLSPPNCRSLQVREDLNVYRYPAGTGGQGP